MGMQANCSGKNASRWEEKTREGETWEYNTIIHNQHTRTWKGVKGEGHKESFQAYDKSLAKEETKVM